MPEPWTDLLWDVLLSPALWLGLMLALTYSVLFSVWRGGGWRQLPGDLLAGGIGFGAGQLAGVLLDINLLRVGEVHVLWGTLGAALLLLLTRRHRAV